MTLREQISRQSLALISLIVALIALGYNTWRNELTEENRNIRQAGFEMLVNIGDLQRIVYLAHFEQDIEAGNPRQGWTEVLVLRDLARVVPGDYELRTEELHAVWRDNWSGLGSNDLAVAAIDKAIDDLRQDVVFVLESLE